jgi:tetratricopeptide (TPR) repeat protein
MPLRSFHDPNGTTYRGELAERLLRRSIKLEPSIGRAHYGLAVALFLQCTPDSPDDPTYSEAVAAAREGERLDPTVPAKTAEGWAAMLQKRYADAERLFGEAIKEHPDVKSTYHSLAMARAYRHQQPQRPVRGSPRAQ